ncbi:uncharacterized protein LOC110034342 [Phalaenopsis equestris]|uniref:uncharacterized protein LOC110034342 n=1 Tax=Phalaenopsis equestris TaxID=78828 RepID=UPI0009E60837|nr:uncharacterized protein LOC110034342 [Phalaenopsis equestris]
MGSEAPSWADQWSTGGMDDGYGRGSSTNSKENKTANLKAATAARLGKAKSAAVAGAHHAKTAAKAGAQKVKSGTSTGISWIKKQYHKRSSK